MYFIFISGTQEPRYLLSSIVGFLGKTSDSDTEFNISLPIRHFHSSFACWLLPDNVLRQLLLGTRNLHLNDFVGFRNFRLGHYNLNAEIIFHLINRATDVSFSGSIIGWRTMNVKSFFQQLPISIKRGKEFFFLITYFFKNAVTLDQRSRSA